ncbi:MAG: GHKL domain-containing protein [Planctomycetes bacterium]|nr:GHKL domain-containing protein [Planctomycetota bacterium]
MRSIRTRLMLTASLALAVLACAIGFTLHQVIRQDLYDSLDQSLETRARTLTALIEEDGDRVSLEWLDPEDEERARPALPEMFVLRNAGGKTVAASRGMERYDGDWPVRENHDVSFATDTIGDRRSRVCVLKFHPKTEDDDEPSAKLQLLVAEPVEETEETLARVRFWILVVGGLGVLLGGGVLFLIVTRETGSLKTLAGRIEELNVEIPASRIEMKNAPSELAPVVAQLNDLLERLETSRTREREFTAGAAHELRTPLAGIRAKLELALSRKRSVEEHAKFEEQSLEIAVGIQGVVERLLNLARLEAGEVLGDPQPVELEPLIEKTWQPFAERAGQRRLEVVLDLYDDKASVHLDALTVVLTNLFENAVNYADENSKLVISQWIAEGGLGIRVKNSASGISPEDAERALEPFWRSDKARRDAGVHAGLGLTLCRRLVQGMGGKFTTKVEDGSFIAELKLNTPKL